MKWLCLALFGAFSASLSWGESAINSSKQQLLELLKPLNGFSAQFNQRLLNPEGTLLQSLSGELHGQKPDKIYWTVSEPAAQTIVSNGSRLWIYDPDLEQVIIEAYSHNPEGNPISLLLGDSQLFSENFELVKHRVLTDSTVQFNLEPLQLNALYKDLIIEFTQDTLSAISFTNNLDHTTQLELDKFTLNPKFEVNFFNFNIPQGVDVVNHVR